MWQHPHNKYMLSCPECNTEMRNPKHKNQTSFEDGDLIKWHHTQIQRSKSK